MRILFIIFLIMFCACNSKQKHRVNPRAKELNDSAVSLVDHSRDYKTAIKLLDEATLIDSNYFFAYNNKFTFLGLSKSEDLNEYLKTLRKLIDLRPDLPDFYFYAGLISQKAGDSISSQKYLNGAIMHYDNILDTTHADYALREIFTLNKGISLILINQNVKGNDLLKTVYDAETDSSYRRKIARFMTMSKQSIIDSLTYLK